MQCSYVNLRIAHLIQAYEKWLQNLFIHWMFFFFVTLIHNHEQIMY